jgi:very-short-patch-repair endonuclease
MLEPMAGVRREWDVTRPNFVATTPDQAIAALAARQHGVVALPQLEALGLARRAVAHRAANGRLHRVHHGVYAIGHPVLGTPGRRMAAVLACGDGAAIGHATAGALWEIRRNDVATIDVVVPTAGGRRRPGLRVHRHPGLRADEVTTRHGIPVTTPARTLLDLAAALPPRKLRRALDQVEILELTDYPALRGIARAHPNHRGAARLRQALADHTAGTTLTRSDLEEVFLGICRTHGLPTPLVNQHVGEDTVDFLFAAERLIVEADSWRYHRTRQAFDRDRRRDWTHAGAGYRTLRFTDRQLEHEPLTVACAVRSALAEPRAA